MTDDRAANLVIECFAGAGGASLGIHAADPSATVIGIELDKWACATRAAAGLQTIRADVSTFPLKHLAGRVTGAWFSPPCPQFSTAGKGAGTAMLGHLTAAVRAILDGDDCREKTRGQVETDMIPIVKAEWEKKNRTFTVRQLHTEAARRAVEACLVLEPARWVYELRPRWVACEQVPAVLPLWLEMGRGMEGLGYRSWAGKLDCASYGIVWVCPLHSLRNSELAGDAALLSRYATDLVSAERFATTPTDVPQMRDVLNVMHHWAEATDSVFAESATCAESASALAVSLEPLVPTTTCGRADASWVSAATSLFGWTENTAESIVSSLKACWDDLSRQRKLSTMWTEMSPTTIRRILRCIAATLTTGPRTGRVESSAGCGLCHDGSVAQNRVRAVLMARHGDRAVTPPEPTHHDPRGSLSLFGLQPWVSMAQKLLWGMTDRPAISITGKTGDGAGGSGARRTLKRERGGGRFIDRDDPR